MAANSDWRRLADAPVPGDGVSLWLADASDQRSVVRFRVVLVGREMLWLRRAGGGIFAVSRPVWQLRLLGRDIVFRDAELIPTEQIAFDELGYP